jgi:rhodanese-related sulfurtransferase
MFGLFKKPEAINYKALVKEGAIILDVRSKGEFEGGHIKGAINIPLDILPAKVSTLGTKDTPIITCCMSGGRSTLAKNILLKAGYHHVHNGGGWHTLHNILHP